MKKRLVWIGAVLSLGLFAAAAWSVTHPGFAIAELQDYVTRKTGRTLVVNGDARLEFFPRLGVRLDNVFLSNPQGMDGNFAHAANARLPLQLADLFRRKLKIREITLIHPIFNILIDREGRSNWVDDGKGAQGGVAKSDTVANPKEPLVLRVENASANFLDERSGQAFSLEDATANITIGDETELDVFGTAMLNGQLARIEAHVKSMRRVGGDGSPLDLTVTSPALTVNFTGRLSTAEKLNLAGAIDATSSDLRLLAKWLGSEIKGNTGLKNFSLAGALDSKGVVFSLAKASIALDGMVANGDVALDLTKKRPRISATLSTDLFTLDPYLRSSETSTANQGSGQDDWNTTRLSFSGLTGIDGNLSLSAFKVKWSDAEFGPAELSGTLKEGRLETDIQDTPLYGGKASARITLDGGLESPVLQLVLDARDIRGERFFEEFARVDWLAGNTGLKVSLSATGNNQQEMLSTLKGNFEIAVSDGEITGLNIVDMISKVRSAVSDGWGKGLENLTSFDGAAASFLIEDGVARSEDVKVESSAFQVSGSGEVDLLRRALDFKFDPALVTGSGQTTRLPIQVVVKGPWHGPKIYPNLEGILDDSEAAYDALRGMGVSEKTFKEIEKEGGKLLKKLFGN
jgi:AsmA protein